MQAAVPRLQAQFRAKVTRTRYQTALEALEKQVGYDASCSPACRNLNRDNLVQEAEFQAAMRRQLRLQQHSKELELLSNISAKDFPALDEYVACSWPAAKFAECLAA